MDEKDALAQLRQDVANQMFLRKPLYEGFQGAMYLAVAINEEAGEIAGEIKKAYRDDGTHLTVERQQKLKLEMGDVLWYLQALCLKLGTTLPEIAQLNQMKLEKRRQNRGNHG